MIHLELFGLAMLKIVGGLHSLNKIQSTGLLFSCLQTKNMINSISRNRYRTSLGVLLLVCSLSLLWQFTLAQFDFPLSDQQLRLLHSLIPDESPEFQSLLLSAPSEDFYKNVTELIEARGFPWEQHYVTTKDGFILSMQRIPHGRKKNSSSPKKVALLQHGLLDASETWVQNFEDESLAFMLADSGCDVWLGNVRGNMYSNRHIHYQPTKDTEFWNWSFDEMAMIDLPTMIEYILKQTGQSQLDAYIGHSQGTIMGFACFSSGTNCSTSTMTDASSHVKQFVALAPVAYVSHVKSGLLRWMAAVHADQWLIHLGFNDFLPSNKWLQKWVPELCHNTLVGQPFCAQVYCAFAGCDSLRDNVNRTRLSTYFSHLPAGTSVMNIAHWAQMVRTGRFEMLDMGTPENNMERYGQDSPPMYPISNLNVDLSLFYGGVDTLGTVEDLKSWLPLIPQNRVKQVKYLANYGHLDIVWGIRANRDIYEHIIRKL